MFVPNAQILRFKTAHKLCPIWDIIDDSVIHHPRIIYYSNMNQCRYIRS